MALDPTIYPDWKIARDAETRMKPIAVVARELGLEDDELLPYGRFMGKIESGDVLRRLERRPEGKYVDVTAITPTPLGEGKSTTTIGLLQGMARRGLRASAAIRQPSGGPTMGMKGSAAGGGLAQCIPLTPYSLNFTGDIHAVTAAHNLAMTALTARMQHERNYDDATLERLSGMRRLNIDGVVEAIPKRRQEHLQVVERKINRHAVFHRAAPAPLGGIVHRLRDLFYLRLHLRRNTLFRAAPGEHVRHGRSGGAAFFGNIFQCSHSKNPL